MNVEFKANKNLDNLKKDPIAFAEQFPCPACETVSKRIAPKKFHCSKCNNDFEIIPNYIDKSDS